MTGRHLPAQAQATVQALRLRRPGSQRTGVPSAPLTQPSNGWINPVQGAPQPGPGSLFGDPRTNWVHQGVDLNAPTGGAGFPIRAAADGVASWIYSTAGGFGVLVEHANGWSTKYYHLGTRDQTVKPYAIANGTRVRQGQIIGYMGDSGNANGPHLHFGMLYNGIPVDPMQTGFFTGTVDMDRFDNSATIDVSAAAEPVRNSIRSVMTGLLTAASHVTAGGNRLTYEQVLDQRLRSPQPPDEAATGGEVTR